MPPPAVRLTTDAASWKNVKAIFCIKVVVERVNVLQLEDMKRGMAGAEGRNQITRHCTGML